VSAGPAETGPDQRCRQGRDRRGPAVSAGARQARTSGVGRGETGPDQRCRQGRDRPGRAVSAGARQARGEGVSAGANRSRESRPGPAVSAGARQARTSGVGRGETGPDQRCRQGRTDRGNPGLDPAESLRIRVIRSLLANKATRRRSGQSSRSALTAVCSPGATRSEWDDWSGTDAATRSEWDDWSGTDAATRSEWDDWSGTDAATRSGRMRRPVGTDAGTRSGRMRDPSGCQSGCQSAVARRRSTAGRIPPLR
jgi:hypothetical protein